MKILQATKKGKKEAIQIAQNLKEWFTKDGIKHMKTDFEHNKVLLAKEQNKTKGFLCYTTDNGTMKLIWLGIKKEEQNKGIGKKLLEKAEKEAKKYELHKMILETLSDEYKYKPYHKTREFYYKNGYKKTGYKKAIVKGWDNEIILEKNITKQTSATKK